MEFRNMFQNIFSGTKDESNNATMTNLKMLNSYENVFSEYRSPLYDDITVRTCINTIARHCSKLQPKHIRRQNNQITPQDTQLDYLLSHRPNALMSTSEFLKKIVVKIYTYGNCFIYIQRDENGNIKSLTPLDYSQMTLKEIKGDVYCKFEFANGNKITVPYSDVIHIRGDFGNSEILGDSPVVALKEQLKLLDTCKKSLANTVKNASAMRGYLKYNTPIKEKDKEKAAEAFNTIANQNGVGVLSEEAEYVDLARTPVSADNEQMLFVRDDVYRFFCINTAIIDGSYTYDQWQSFYESVIEPISIQLSLEFSHKIFTDRERGYGNEIIFGGNRLQYASLQSKVDMVYKLLPQSVITINDALEMLNMPPCDDPELGNKRFMTKNNDQANTIAGTSKGGEENNGTENGIQST